MKRGLAAKLKQMKKAKHRGDLERRDLDLWLRIAKEALGSLRAAPGEVPRAVKHAHVVISDQVSTVEVQVTYADGEVAVFTIPQVPIIPPCRCGLEGGPWDPSCLRHFPNQEERSQ